MKPIVALMITGLLASSAAMAQESKMAAPAAPAATAPSAEPSTGDQPAKKSAHHKKKKSRAAMARADAEKKGAAKPSTDAGKPETAPSEMKK